MDFLLTVLYLVIVLGIMVLVHELGHFIVAKLCGVRIETFSLGFGPRIFGFRRGETDYRISAIPLGGYVKMAGDNPGEAALDPSDFNARPRWQRVLVALAGPFSNFILAFVLMTVVGLYHHEVDQYLTRAASVDWVIAKTPAADSGLKPGDTIVHFDTVENPTWRDVDERSLLNLNQHVSLSYLHDGTRYDTSILVKSDGKPDDYDREDVGFVPVLQDSPVQVMQLESGMPAAVAGIKPGDKLVSIDGVQVHSVEAVLAYLQQVGPHPLTLDVLRGSQHLPITLTPQISNSNDGTPQYHLGFRATPTPMNVDRLPLPAALAYARQSNWHDSRLVLQVLRRMFGGRVPVTSLSGPIGIGQEIGLAAKQGIWALLQVTAMLSLNLGIFNLLPFPVLDGGMILFLLIESIIRRDVNQTWKERIYQAAFVVLILFAAFVIFNDLTKLSVFNKIKL